MKIVWERLSNTGNSSLEAHELDFFRVDCSQKLKLPPASIKAVPVLIYPHAPNVRYREQDLQEALQCHRDAAQKVAQVGFKTIALAVDDDGLLQKYLSPRYETVPFLERLKPMIDLYEHLKPDFDKVWVFLTVEELCPGGLDPLDGITIAQELEKVGLKNIVAKSGTRDFPYLFNRRETTPKDNQPAFHANEPELASALWLKQHTGLDVFGSLLKKPSPKTEQKARVIGLSGIVYPLEDVPLPNK